MSNLVVHEKGSIAANSLEGCTMRHCLIRYRILPLTWHVGEVHSQSESMASSTRSFKVHFSIAGMQGLGNKWGAFCTWRAHR